ncbi:alpha/beta-hydrolase [Setomelanomma holmii]|uniref:Carboxylic ester hydrolase n=1 Tax=Setomelanomma holmii TaxID=210430 RepID=A0A9P4LR63_9PLEO|nr:alpha/beta-hydrolase [Setomelanomma holmii]
MAISNMAEPPNTYTFEHPVLGSMIGLVPPETPDIVRFRAIPYATIPGRFQHSIPLDNLDTHSRIFTQPGHACPHSFSVYDDQSGGPYPGEAPIKTSEYDCLILEINVPKSHLEGSKSDKLPVLTYIHGGGFFLGKIDAQHNTAYMAQHSRTIGKPVITTALQYRFGALGFLATPDGGKNFALRDQQNALLWVQKFVIGFGGDARKVTVFGESAGAVSICCHMLSHVPSSGPLFQRVVLMSGVLGPMMTPQPVANATKNFSDFCTSLGITDTGIAALENLRALPVEKIVAASEAFLHPGIIWPPVQDPSFFRYQDITWDTSPILLGQCEWISHIIIGTTGFEGAANRPVINKLTPATFLAQLKTSLSDDAAEKVMRAYDIQVGMDQNRFVTKAMRWCGNLIFDAPIHATINHLTTHTSKCVYRYIFDIRNPYPNAPFYQQAHHWVDVYFVFRALQFRYPYEYLKDLSDTHAELWIRFACGEEPWSRYNASGNEVDGERVIMVADEREGWVEKTMREYEEMSKVEWKVLDELWEAWEEKKGAEWFPLNMVSLKHLSS